MPIIRQLERLPDAARGGAVAIGNFDGVHRGHARLIEQLVTRSRELAGPAVVFTFDPHPARLLHPETCPTPLTWVERKADLLAALGIDWLVAYPTDASLLNLSARDFFDAILVRSLGVRAIVEGPNFYFGHQREGNVKLLGELAAAHGISLDVVQPVEVDGQLVSSSRVRQLVAAGELKSAQNMLTAPYRIRGLVTHGAGRGAKLGFPTANLAGIDTLLPAHGVYAGIARLDDGPYPAAVNLGPNPTFGEPSTKVEVHVLGYDQPLYGQVLEVDFLERLRTIESFTSIESLVAQIHLDTAATRRIADEYLQNIPFLPPQQDPPR